MIALMNAAASFTTDENRVAIDETLDAIEQYHRAEAHVRGVSEALPDGPARQRWLPVARKALEDAEARLVLALHAWNPGLRSLADLDRPFHDHPRSAVVAAGRLYLAEPNDERDDCRLIVLDLADVPQLPPAEE